jgi:DNA-binding transcriptional LysR family regulator
MSTPRCFFGDTDGAGNACRPNCRHGALLPIPLAHSSHALPLERSPLLLDRQFVNEPARPLTMRVESNSFETISGLVKAGLGSAVRTRVGIMDELARGELVFVPFTDANMHTDNIAICTKRRRPLPVAASILIERLIAELPRLGAAG